MIKFMRSIWLCTRLILKKMVEKILVQNEFVDFDLELSDFNLFVEIDAPLFEKACTMGGFYNGKMPRDSGIVWRDFRNVPTKRTDKFSDFPRHIINLFEENKEKLVKRNNREPNAFGETRGR